MTLQCFVTSQAPVASSLASCAEVGLCFDVLNSAKHRKVIVVIDGLLHVMCKNTVKSPLVTVVTMFLPRTSLS
jgi:hypothetical protein